MQALDAFLRENAIPCLSLGTALAAFIAILLFTHHNLSVGWRASEVWTLILFILASVFAFTPYLAICAGLSALVLFMGLFSAATLRPPPQPAVPDEPTVSPAHKFAESVADEAEKYSNPYH